MKEKKYLMYSETRYTNLRFLQCDIVVAAVLVLAYLVELLKKNRDLPYYLIFCAFVVLPVIAGAILYKKDPEKMTSRIVLAVGYTVMYGFVLLTSTSILNFVYIIPLLVMIPIFQSSRLTLGVGILTVVINIAYVVFCVVTKEVRNEDVVNFEIEIAVIGLVVAFNYVTAKALENISSRKMGEIGAEKEKSDQLLRTIMSTTDTLCGNISGISSEASGMAGEGGNAREAINEIMEGTNELAMTIQNQLEMSENITEMTNSAVRIAEDVQGRVNTTKNMAESGSDDVVKLQEASVVCKNAGDEVSVSMKELARKTEQALELLSMIENVTEQTTLLAFNASIEAARAGDTGRGFSVVAEEIKKLAEETQHATEEISALFGQLRMQTKNASESVDELLEANEKQTELINKTGNTFLSIKENIEGISGQMNQQVSQIEKVFTSNNEISQSVENLSAFSEQLLANMENTKSLTENTVDGTVKISGLLDSVMEDIENLQKMSTASE